MIKKWITNLSLAFGLAGLLMVTSADAQNRQGSQSQRRSQGQSQTQGQGQSQGQQEQANELRRHGLQVSQTGHNELTVTRVQPGSAADQAGFQQGDSIVSVNDQEIGGADELNRHVMEMGQQTQINFKVERDGEHEELTLQGRDVYGTERGESTRRSFNQNSSAGQDRSSSDQWNDDEQQGQYSQSGRSGRSQQSGQNRMSRNQSSGQQDQDQYSQSGRSGSSQQLGQNRARKNRNQQSGQNRSSQNQWSDDQGQDQFSQSGRNQQPGRNRSSQNQWSDDQDQYSPSGRNQQSGQNRSSQNRWSDDQGQDQFSQSGRNQRPGQNRSSQNQWSDDQDQYSQYGRTGRSQQYGQDQGSEGYGRNQQFSGSNRMQQGRGSNQWSDDGFQQQYGQRNQSGSTRRMSDYEGQSGGGTVYGGQERAALGVTLSESTSEEGVRINRVLRGSPAEEAGLESSDLILSVNGREVQSYRDVMRLVSQQDPNENVSITVQRDGEEEEMEVRLGRSQEVFQGQQGRQQYQGGQSGRSSYSYGQDQQFQSQPWSGSGQQDFRTQQGFQTQGTYGGQSAGGQQGFGGQQGTFQGNQDRSFQGPTGNFDQGFNNQPQDGRPGSFNVPRADRD